MSEKIPDLTHPSLKGLAYALRHMKEVAPNHRYYHGYYAMPERCGTAGCAIGVAYLLWPEEIGGTHEDPQHIDYFGDAAYEAIFDSDAYGGGYAADAPVTPEMVADRIDTWLAEHGETRG